MVDDKNFWDECSKNFSRAVEDSIKAKKRIKEEEKTLASNVSKIDNLLEGDFLCYFQDLYKNFEIRKYYGNRRIENSLIDYMLAGSLDKECYVGSFLFLLGLDDNARLIRGTIKANGRSDDKHGFVEFEHNNTWLTLDTTFGAVTLTESYDKIFKPDKKIILTKKEIKDKYNNKQYCYFDGNTVDLFIKQDSFDPNMITSLPVNVTIVYDGVKIKSLTADITSRG